MNNMLAHYLDIQTVNYIKMESLWTVNLVYTEEVLPKCELLFLAPFPKSNTLVVINVFKTSGGDVRSYEPLWHFARAQEAVT